MELEVLCRAMDASLTALVNGRDFPEQADARAFGGFVEQAVLTEWTELCEGWAVTPRPHPGRRSIYDASFEIGGLHVGVDFRTKDLRDNRYSDGGLCAVGNLLRFMVRDKAVLLITEFGYAIEDGAAVFAHVVTAPVHALPVDTYRIENLGTGQLRLDASVHESADKVDWSRPPAQFLASFAPLCVAHYERVKVRAEARIQAIDDFVASGFETISLK